MTPEEKAIRLYNTFFDEIQGKCINDLSAQRASRDCALIAVDEIIKMSAAADMSPAGLYCLDEGELNYSQYWQQVKEEINRLCT